MCSVQTIEYYSTEKKKKEKEILTRSVTMMNLEGIMLTEICRSQKDKYHTIPLT